LRAASALCSAMSNFDVIAIGAGAAGMMCAATAAQRARRVLLIDHAAKLGEKIRISGGGRCNFTNIHCTPEHFLSNNPDFCRSALARYTPRDFVALIDKHGIAYHEKKLGQLFCDESAQQIIDMLRSECDSFGVKWRMPCHVNTIRKTSEGFIVNTGEGELETAALVIATGGLSIPKLGASPFGYKVAEQFGLSIVLPRPALVPLAFDAGELARYGDLSELSSKTMEARRVPGLYFIGEVVDVTGHLGGFNFQWAWASGFVAGQSV